MSWVTLTEAISILSLELGYESFTQKPSSQKSSALLVTTSGQSNNLQLSGSGDLTTQLENGDLVLIGEDKFTVNTVSANSMTISGTVDLPSATTFDYVKKADIGSWESIQTTKNQALITAYKEIRKNLTDPDLPVDNILKEAQAKLAAHYYRKRSELPNQKKDKSRIKSESIGDMSYSYDSSQAEESLPKFIINILGSHFASKFSPVFFDR